MRTKLRTSRCNQITDCVRACVPGLLRSRVVFPLFPGQSATALRAYGHEGGDLSYHWQRPHSRQTVPSTSPRVVKLPTMEGMGRCGGNDVSKGKTGGSFVFRHHHYGCLRKQTVHRFRQFDPRTDPKSATYSHTDNVGACRFVISSCSPICMERDGDEEGRACRRARTKAFVSHLLPYAADSLPEGPKCADC